MINGFGVGVVSYIRSSISGIGRLVNALLTFSVELGMLLLAILGLFMLRKYSELGVLAVTWASTFVRRLARRVVIRHWECRDVGHPHVDGQEAVECGLGQALERDGRREYTSEDTYRARTWSTELLIRLATKILSLTSREIKARVKQGG